MKYMTLPRAAEYCGLSKETLRRARAAGRVAYLDVSKAGRGEGKRSTYLFTAEDLDAFMAWLTVPANPTAKPGPARAAATRPAARPGRACRDAARAVAESRQP
ncbi:MAG: helix-turn-helix domain-containing protein [Bifidobacteriaceae bacterium]|jgi:hypothetical protein|nr:helix-turn-helix domain-containing protein [Bifidobacteriaceae bacterium]